MNDINVQCDVFRLMTFNVVNLCRQRSTSYVSNVFDVLTAISDDEYCLERDVTRRDVQI
jgi:hypothetical protein